MYTHFELKADERLAGVLESFADTFRLLVELKATQSNADTCLRCASRRCNDCKSSKRHTRIISKLQDLGTIGGRE